jgi:hypothetical protein
MFISNIERVINWEPIDDTLCHVCKSDNIYCTTSVLRVAKFNFVRRENTYKHTNRVLCRDCFNETKAKFPIVDFPRDFDRNIKTMFYNTFKDKVLDFIDNITAITGDYRGDSKPCMYCSIYNVDKVVVRDCSITYYTIPGNIKHNFVGIHACNQCIELMRHQNRKFVTTVNYDAITDRVRNYH